MPLRRACPFAVLVLLACGGGGPSRPPVASVSLTPSAPAPLTSLGDTVLLTAVALDAGGAPILGVGIAFSTSDATVATVTQGGLVTAVANGNATIHASAEGKEATTGINLAQVVAQVVVTPSSIRVPQNETPLFHAAALDARNHPVVGAPPPAWTTTDAALATIVTEGVTDGRVTVSAGGGLMTVDSTATYAEAITVSPAAVTPFSSLNQTAQLSATASNPRLGDVTSSVTFTWTSSSPGVA